MSQDDIIPRLSVKSREHLFLDELENGFEPSPKEAKGILESAKTMFNLERVSHKGNTCRDKKIVLSKDASRKKPLSQLKKVELPSPETVAKKTLMFFRNMVEPAFERCVSCDWSRRLYIKEESSPKRISLGSYKVNVRTIKRDIAHLRKLGYLVHTRGQIKGIGRGKSHKVAIVQLYPQRYTYTQIS